MTTPAGDPPAAAAAPPVLNVANLLTAARIVLVPVFVVLAVVSGMTDSTWRIAACVAFFVASVTDFVDGWIARTWNLVTSFGKVADPIADKALTGTALVLLSAYGRLPWWVTGVILVREWGITALRFWVLRHGVIPASRGGKAKTALQILAITWYLWPFAGPLAAVGPWLMAAAVLVTLATGVDYVVQGLRMRRPPLPDPAARPTGPTVLAGPATTGPTVLAGPATTGPTVLAGPATTGSTVLAGPGAAAPTAPAVVPPLPPADEAVA